MVGIIIVLLLLGGVVFVEKQDVGSLVIIFEFKRFEKDCIIWSSRVMFCEDYIINYLGEFIIGSLFLFKFYCVLFGSQIGDVESYNVGLAWCNVGVWCQLVSVVFQGREGVEGGFVKWSNDLQYGFLKGCFVIGSDVGLELYKDLFVFGVVNVIVV